MGSVNSEVYISLPPNLKLPTSDFPPPNLKFPISEFERVIYNQDFKNPLIVNNHLVLQFAETLPRHVRKIVE